MKYFRGSIIVSVIGILLAGFWGLRISSITAIQYGVLALFLGILEVSLSFDNAVINATKLEKMNSVWQKRFLTWGILVAVFGMRLIFPVVIVSIFSHTNILETFKLAIFDSTKYSHHLESYSTFISAFGGIFLYMIFLTFIFDEDKTHHWIVLPEEIATKIHKFEKHISIYVAGITISLITIFTNFNWNLCFSMLSGLGLFLIINTVSDFILEKEDKFLKHAGMMLFLYLELIDASFSFDGVIGAFALSKDVVLIAIGLGIGAMFVRSLTLYLVDKKVLKEYVYLEHGAHWAIGVLSLIMLSESFFKVPNIVTGIIGAGFIGIAYWFSIKEKTNLVEA